MLISRWINEFTNSLHSLELFIQTSMNSVRIQIWTFASAQFVTIYTVRFCPKKLLLQLSLKLIKGGRRHDFISFLRCHNSHTLKVNFQNTVIYSTYMGFVCISIRFLLSKILEFPLCIRTLQSCTILSRLVKGGWSWIPNFKFRSMRGSTF